MRLHIVMHESYEAPAAFEDWARNKSHQVSYTRLYDGDVFPEDVEGFDFLILMGGPQSPATTVEESPHFDAAREISFIKKALAKDKYVLGVCLGAQLVGEAFGAKFEHSPNKEIGVFDLSLTEAAKENEIFSSFPQAFPVGHWHGDMPGLTKDAVVLATSEGCPRQIVWYSPRVYGFQCHFEFTPKSIEGMIKNCGHELTEAATAKYIETDSELRSHDYKVINERLFRFLDAIQTRFEAEQK